MTLLFDIVGGLILVALLAALTPWVNKEIAYAIIAALFVVVTMFMLLL